MTALERVLADKSFGERYEIGEQLGAGGMGEVFRGVQKALSRPVAIKMLAAELTRDPMYVERFQAEAKLASGLIHSNVVAVFDFGIAAGDVPFLVTELVEGEPLSAVLERSLLPPETVLEIITQTLDGLAAIHRLGIVHRDIKPENLLISLSPHVVVKIADFGIAKGSGAQAGPKTATGLMLGTPAYMAPEQIVGDPLSPSSDLYALALISYQLIVGRHPFLGGTAMDVVARQVHADPAVPDELFRGVREALVRGLAKNPAHRFQTAAEFKAALLQVASVVTSSGTWRREGPTAGEGQRPTRQTDISGINIGLGSGVASRASKDGSAVAKRPSKDPSGVHQRAPGDVSSTRVASRIAIAPTDIRPKPAARPAGGGSTVVWALVIAAIAGAAAFGVRNFKRPVPVASTADPRPSVAAPVPVTLQWVERVGRLLDRADPDATIRLFSYMSSEKGLGRLVFTDPVAMEVDQLLFDAVGRIGVEPPAVGSTTTPESKPAQLFRELAGCLRSRLTPESAKCYEDKLGELMKLTREDGEPLLHRANVLVRLGAAFRMMRAQSADELIGDVQFLLVAARSQAPAGGWCARLAEAATAQTSAGEPLAGVASRRGQAAAETAKNPKLAAVLEMLELELREVSKRCGGSANSICTWRRRWLQADVMQRIEAASKRGSGVDLWLVPSSVNLERLNDIEGFPTEVATDLQAHVTSGTLNRDTPIDVPYLATLARALGCSASLIDRVEKDFAEGCQP